MLRRNLLKLLGIGIVAPFAVKDLIASSPAATEFVEDINERVEYDVFEEPVTIQKSNSLDACIPELWAQEALKIIQENTRFSSMVNRDFSDKVVATVNNDTVIVKRHKDDALQYARNAVTLSPGIPMGTSYLDGNLKTVRLS